MSAANMSAILEFPKLSACTTRPHRASLSPKEGLTPMGPCLETVDGTGNAPPAVPTHSMADARQTLKSKGDPGDDFGFLTTGGMG